MTKAQAAKAAEIITDVLTYAPDEGDSLELVHLELRANTPDDADGWTLITSHDDREEDRTINRTFITVIDGSGEVTENYESN